MDKNGAAREEVHIPTWASAISQQLKLPLLILFTVQDELILKMSGWVYSNL